MELRGNEVDQLLGMLSEGTAPMRRFALMRLAEIGTLRVVPALRKAVSDSDASVAYQAERALNTLLQRGLGAQELPLPTLRRFVGPASGPAGDEMTDEELAALQATGRAILRPFFRRMHDLLECPDRVLARLTISAMGKARDRACVDVLIRSMERKELAADCAAALAQIGDERCVSALLRLLDSNDEDLVCDAIFALGSFRRDEVVEALVRRLGDDRSRIRADAALVLGNLGSARAVDAVAARLDDEDALVVERAVLAIAKLGLPDLGRVLLTRYESESRERIRAVIVASTALIGVDPLVCALLEKALGDPDARVRANAVEAIDTLPLPKERKLRMLAPVKTDGNNRVRGNLAIALGSLDTLKALELLTHLLNSSDKWQRASAVYAAGFIPERQVGEWLANAFQYEEDADVIRNNVASLARFRDQSVVEAMVKSLGHFSSLVRSGAARVLGQIGDAFSRDALLEAMEHEGDENVRAEILTALGRLAGTSHIPRLAAALKDASPRVQANAIDALDAVGGVDILPYVDGFLFSADNRVKANAARTLWRRGQLEVVHVLGQMLEEGDPAVVASAVYALGEIGASLDELGESSQLFLLISALSEVQRSERGEDANPSPEGPPLSRRRMLHAAEALWPAVLAMDAHDYDRSRELLRRSRAAACRYVYGALRRRGGEGESALKELGAAARSLEHFVNPVLDVANLHHERGELAESIRHFLRGTAIQLDVLRQQVDLGLSLLDEGRLADSSEVLKKLMSELPPHSTLHGDMADLQQLVGRPAEGVEHAFLAFLAEPTRPPAAYRVAQCAADAGLLDLARLFCENTLSLRGLSDELRGRLERLGARIGGEGGQTA